MGLDHWGARWSRAGAAALLAGLLALAPFGGPAAAQDAAKTWHGALTLYGWLPGLEGSAAIPGSGLQSDFSVGADDLLEAVNFAAFATGELRYGRYGLLADLFYSNMSTSETVGLLGRREITTKTKLLLVTAFGSWRAWEGEQAFVDLLAGGRLGSSDLTLSLRVGGPPAVRRASADESWFDPLIGIRAGTKVTDRLSVTGIADIGGFGVGSNLTWEVFVGGSYAFTDRVSADLGFRYLAIDYDASRLDLDLRMFGPAAGITVRF
ncbi:MAG TPA: hypothetical protein VFR34_14610 [Paracoccaceae bacterium]|nr:hypothetical protein [Paracoccaceae bacterium]